MIVFSAFLEASDSEFRVSLFSFQSSRFWITCDPLLISLQQFTSSLYEVLRLHAR